MKKLMMFVLVIALSAVSAFGAISPATWSVKASGSNNNGGAYFGSSADYSKTIGPKWALTAVTTAGADAILLSASASSDMVGSCANIVSGTNFTAGRYEIISVVASTSITLDRTCTTGAGADGVVNIGGALGTISAAITAAAVGDTIIVFPGTYAETVVVNKKLTIYGYGATISRSASDDVVAVTLSGDEIVFEGFTITNAGNTDNDYAMDVSGSRCIASKCTMTSAASAEGKSPTSNTVACSGDFGILDSCWIKGGANNITGIVYYSSTAQNNRLSNTIVQNSTNAATIYDAGIQNSIINCSVFNSYDYNGLLTGIACNSQTVIQNTSVYIASSGTANTGNYDRRGIGGGTGGTINGCNVFVTTSGTDIANAVGIENLYSALPFTVRDTSIYVSATATKNPYAFQVSNGCTIITSGCSFNTNYVNLNTTGKLLYLPVNVLQSGGAAPMAITDILKAGSYPIWTDSNGKVKTQTSSIFGNN